MPEKRIPRVVRDAILSGDKRLLSQLGNRGNRVMNQRRLAKKANLKKAKAAQLDLDLKSAHEMLICKFRIVSWGAFRIR